MTEYSKEIFSNPTKLREKLELFLGDKNKVEIYATACEKYFQKGDSKRLTYSMSWSWWGFVMCFWYLLYRKIYAQALMSAVMSFVFFIVANFIVGFFGKFYFAQRFEEFLDLQDDAMLVKNGGKNKWAIYLFLAFLFINIVFLAGAVYVYNIAIDSDIDIMTCLF